MSDFLDCSYVVLRQRFADCQTEAELARWLTDVGELLAFGLDESLRRAWCDQFAVLLVTRFRTLDPDMAIALVYQHTILARRRAAWLHDPGAHRRPEAAPSQTGPARTQPTRVWRWLALAVSGVLLACGVLWLVSPAWSYDDILG